MIHLETQKNMKIGKEIVETAQDIQNGIIME